MVVGTSNSSELPAESSGGKSCMEMDDMESMDSTECIVWCCGTESLRMNCGRLDNDDDDIELDNDTEQQILLRSAIKMMKNKGIGLTRAERCGCHDHSLVALVIWSSSSSLIVHPQSHCP